MALTMPFHMVEITPFLTILMITLSESLVHSDVHAGFGSG